MLMHRQCQSTQSYHRFCYSQSQILCFQKWVLAKWMLCEILLIRLILKGAKLIFACWSVFDGIKWYISSSHLVTVNFWTKKFCCKNLFDRLVGKFFLHACFSKCYAFLITLKDIFILTLLTQQYTLLTHLHLHEKVWLLKILAFVKWQLWSHCQFSCLLSDI